MAVAEKPKVPETKPKNPVLQLAQKSVLGGLLVFVSLAVCFSLLPTLWGNFVTGILNNNIYLSNSLLLIVGVAAGVGLLALCIRLEGTSPQKGLRAGSVFMTIGLFLTFVLGLAGVNWLATRELGVGVAWGGGVIIAGLILAVFYWLLTRPAFSQTLVKWEEQGWFHPRAFKYNQGMRVRRATLVAFLAIVGFGIYWAVESRFFGSGTWAYGIPPTDYEAYILFQMNIALPVVLAAILMWLCWRLINLPAFADFLIATEAEMNKVSWTTRKRLIQDTIVVLITVVLFTMFLFLIDLLWIRVLSLPVPGVLKVDPKKVMQQGPAEW
jgi:preprotein translocase SecE subunit